jgi:hypothetical protein
MFNFKKFWGNDIIEFYCHPSLKGIIPEPRPARKDLPPWFKNLAPICSEDGGEDFRDSFGNKAMSAKKCLPLLDGMSLGFTIPIGGDVHVRSNHDNSQISVVNPPGGVVFCEFHRSSQVGGPNAIKSKHGNPLKFINHWIIKTAPGWSTLFVPPLNNFEQPFTCLSALVDTDVYPKEVNFPALLNIKDADEHIPAGTPLVTAIPIKRDVFDIKKTPIKEMSDKEFENIGKIGFIQNTRAHYYTHELRIKK